MSQNENDEKAIAEQAPNSSSSSKTFDICEEEEALIVALQETQNLFDRFLLEIDSESLNTPENETNCLETLPEIDEELTPDVLSEPDWNHDDFIAESSSIAFDDNNFPQTVSHLETHIVSTTENKKSKILQLPQEQIPASPSRCENELVGDDVANRRAHIVCECEEAGVAGGAVPIVTSFTAEKSPQEHETDENTNVKEQKVRPKSKASLIPKLTNSFRSNKAHLPSPSGHHKLDSSDPEKSLSSKMLAFQEKLRVTSSLLKAKISSTETLDEFQARRLNFSPDTSKEKVQQNPLLNDFYVNISKLNMEAMNLSRTKAGSSMMAIESIEKLVSDLKHLISKLKKSEKFGNTSEKEKSESVLNSKSKDNKIYIKFLANKTGTKKKKSFNSEVQTDSINEPAQIKLNDEVMCPRNQDSMDGLFIPSQEAPFSIEEEEDEEIVDITITFPEFQQKLKHETDSHLSVCFSDISAEALGRLKRCPKDFTLHMNFVQGKMIFQTGNLPVNNFSIGTDLKITECTIDSRKSDIISIKPSTECAYASQVIPVEGETRKSSLKTLKSTDSELFNVVSLPFINRKTSVTTKSCITFKNDVIFPSGVLLSDRWRYKSMPQIPSLTRIVEEPILELVSNSKAVLGQTEKKLRTRHLQRKRTNTSLDKIHDTP